MGTKTSIGLKAGQTTNRFIVLCCSVVGLGIYSYFLAALHSRHLYIPRWTRAVEGITGAAVLYTLLGLSLLWCLAGHRVASALAILLDLCFIGGFIYVAYENRGGAGRCRGNSLRTPFGTAGAQTTRLTNTRGNTVETPRFKTLCRLETAVLAVSIIAIFFLLCALVSELLLIRSHRKAQAYGPGPNNNYTSGPGYGAGAGVDDDDAEMAGTGKRRGLFGRSRRNRNGGVDNGTANDALPVRHPNPRESYNTEATATGGYDTVPLHTGNKPAALNDPVYNTGAYNNANTGYAANTATYNTKYNTPTNF